MKISRGGGGGLVSGISPCFGSLELRGGMVCFPLVLARAVCILKGGVVGCKVATLGMMLLEMVVVLAGELSLAMASSVWGFARARFSRIK